MRRLRRFNLQGLIPVSALALALCPPSFTQSPATVRQTPATVRQTPDEAMLREPVRRSAEPPGEEDARWALARSEEKPGFVLDQDPVFQIHRLLAQWSDAWANMRVDEYLSHYSRAFVPNEGVPRNNWERARRQRLEEASFIRIEISEMSVELQPAAEEPRTAEVSFRQQYTSDHYGDVVLKTLRVVRRRGSWEIVLESSVALEGH